MDTGRISAKVSQIADRLIEGSEIPKEEYVQRVRIIEHRSQDEVYRILSRSGIERNSQDWSDYSKAKRLIFSGMYIDEKVYQRQIQWLTDYLNL